jgi:hypothetical protein
VNACYAVRIVTFVSKKPNLTAQKPLFMTTPAIITVFLTISYGCLSFKKSRDSLLLVIRLHYGAGQILWFA